jgi:hypothetical protein
MNTTSADFEDIGKLVSVSNDGEQWEQRELARIVVEHERPAFYVWSESDPTRCEPIKYACKFDPLDDGNPITTEKLFMLQKMRIDECSDQLAALRDGQASIEKQIQKEWREKGIKKLEIQIGSRRVSLSMNVKIFCNVKKDRRQYLTDYVQENNLDFLVSTDIDTTRLKSWMEDNAERKDDGSFDLSFVPQEMAESLFLYQQGKMSVRKVGVSE